MRNNIALFIFMLFFIPFSVCAQETEAGKPIEEAVEAIGESAYIDIDKLVEKAIRDNPELKAAEARWQMFKSRIIHGEILDDPMIMLKLQNGIVTRPLDFKRDPMTQKVIGISQKYTLQKKRDLKVEAAAQEAESYRWNIEERKLELARMVKETCYRIFMVDKELEIVARNIKLMDDTIILTQNMYGIGIGVQQDIFKAQVERSKMFEMQITLEKERKSLEANLNSLIYEPVNRPVGKVGNFTLKPLLITGSELKERAERDRPVLKSYITLINKAEAMQRLAEAEEYPDFDFSFEYMQRNDVGDMGGEDMYSIGVTFNIPVRKEHRHAMYEDASYESAMMAEELNGLKNSISNNIAELLASLEEKAKLVELYKTGIIPQAEQAFESATVSYQINKIDFQMLLDSRITLFNYETEYYKTLAEYQMKLAELEAVVGGNLK